MHAEVKLHPKRAEQDGKGAGEMATDPASISVAGPALRHSWPVSMVCGPPVRRPHRGLQVQFQIIIRDNAKNGLVKVPLDNRVRYTLKFTVALVAAEEPVKVLFRSEF